MVRGLMRVRCMGMLRWLHALVVFSHIFDRDRFSGDARIHDCIVEEAVLVRVGVSALTMLWLETYALSLIVHVLTVLLFMMRVDSTNRSLSWLTGDLVVLIRGSIRRHFEVFF
jgi:hypothetical protein